MKPPKRASIQDYEKVSTEDFIPGEIEDIRYDQDHVFKFPGKPDRISPAVRIKFKLEGYQYPHYSRWMTFNYGEKSVLYQKYLASLVEGAKPDMDFDLDQLKKVRVKTLWVEKNGFQSVETVRPVGKKITPRNVVDNQEPLAEVAETDPDESPF